MNSYRDYLDEIAKLVDDAAALPSPEPKPALDASTTGNAPKVLICSPHPDDECIIGLLPLRLMREAGMRVVNLGVTLGSNKNERGRRKGELENACAYLGWDLRLAGSEGLDNVTPMNRAGASGEWTEKVEELAGHLLEVKPHVLCFPHENDWNGTHEGVHLLVMDALQAAGGEIKPYLVETEFWHPMDHPNLMVEADAENLSLLVAGTSLHAGEVARNPYHLLLPAWMQDNVRRGGERVGGQGNAAPAFNFATLYRLRRWRGANAEDALEHGRFISANEDLAALFA